LHIFKWVIYCGTKGVSNIVLQEYTNDKWKSLLDLIRGYSAHRAYQYLTSANAPTDTHHLSNILHRQVSLKVSLFGWRLLHDRLPTKDNLLRRHVITSYNTLWPVVVAFRRRHNIFF